MPELYTNEQMISDLNAAAALVAGGIPDSPLLLTAGVRALITALTETGTRMAEQAAGDPLPEEDDDDNCNCSFCRTRREQQPTTTIIPDITEEEESPIEGRIKHYAAMEPEEFRNHILMGWELETQESSVGDVQAEWEEWNEDTPGLEAKYDGTVGGAEITTIGANTFDACVGYINQFALTESWEADEECSFHIHVSLPGIRPSYGAGMQRELMAYVLYRVHKQPERYQFLRDRWLHETEDEEQREFFRLEECDDRYTFVAHRGNTWEFRCFGNVNCVGDAMKCLQLAVDAMHHVYKTKAGLVPRITPNTDASEGKVFEEDDDSDIWITDFSSMLDYYTNAAQRVSNE